MIKKLTLLLASIFFTQWLQAQLTVNLGPDIQTCQSVLLDAGSYTGTPTYRWSNLATTRTITATSSGIYSVTVTRAGLTATDAVSVTIGPVPSLTSNSDNFCVGQRDVTPQHNGNSLFWYDVPTSSVPTFLGNTRNFNLTGPLTLEVQPLVVSSLLSPPVGPTPTGTTANTTINGAQFNAYRPFILNEVTMVSGNAGQATVTLQDANSVALATMPVTLTAGSNVVTLDFFVPQGNGYRLLVTARSAGLTLRQQTAAAGVYPIGMQGFGQITGTMSTTSTTPSTSIYGVFFNWKLRDLCLGVREAYFIGAFPSPNNVIPTDTSLCGGTVVLNATFPGANYQWSNGATTAIVTASNSGQYVFTVTANACSTIDSVLVEGIAPPVALWADTVVCSGLQTISPHYSGDKLLWFNTSTQSLPTSITNSRSLNISAATTLLLSPVRFGANITQPLGPTFSGSLSSGLMSGSQFNAYRSFIIRQVELNSTLGGVITVELRTSSGQVVETKSLNIVVGTNNLNLDFYVPKGNGYRLVVAQRPPSMVFRYMNAAAGFYPSDLGEYGQLSAAIVNGATDGRYSGIFFRWRLSNVCVGPKIDWNIDISSSQPTNNMPTDTVGCSDIVLDASFPGAIYMWANGGATTPTITATTSGIYRVTISSNGCVTRDSVNVFIGSSFVALQSTGVNVCAGNVNVTPSYQGDRLLWYDSPTQVSATAVTNSRSLVLNNNTSYYLLPVVFAGTLSPNLGPAPSGNLNSGVILATLFNANRAFMLRQVDLIANVAGSVTIQLQNNLGDALESKVVSLSAGSNSLTLDFYVPQGNNLQLVVVQKPTNMTFRYVGTGTGIYPIAMQGFGQMTSTVNNGATSTAVFGPFFNWSIVDICVGTRTPFNVTVTIPPSNNIPTDTITCGTVVLDASFPNATYQWSTVATTSSISVTNSGVIGFTVTSGNCATTDEINVITTQTPLAQWSNVASCPGNVTITPASSADRLLWYDSPTQTSPTFVGATRVENIASNTTYYIEPVAFAGGLSPSLGPVPSGNLTTNALSGAEFDANRECMLNQVEIFSSIAGAITVQLMNSSGVVLETKFFSVTAGANLLSLDFFVPLGTGHRLNISQRTAGMTFLYVSATSNPFPVRLSTFGQITGTFNGNGAPVQFSHCPFFNWRMSYYCKGARSPLNVVIGQRPTNTIPSDTITCGNVVLDASFPNSTYQWTGGASTSSITVNSSGTYSFSVTANGCVATDTVRVTTAVPGSAQWSPVSMCTGAVTLTPAYTGDRLLWYDSPTQSIATFVGNTRQLSLSSNTTYYLEPLAFAGGLSPSLGPVPSGNLNTNVLTGAAFDANRDLMLRNVEVIPTIAGNITVQLQNSGGTVLATRQFSVTAGSNILDLDMLVPQGTGYRLNVTQRTAGMNFLFRSASGNPFPFTLGTFGRITGTFNGNGAPAQSSHGPFFNWQMSYYCSGPRTPLAVTVNPYPTNTIPADTIACGNVTLDATFPNANYIWQNGNTTPSTTFGTNGTFGFTVTANGCSTTDTVRIVTALPARALWRDTSVCAGSIAFAPLYAGDRLLWFDNATQVSPTLVANNRTITLASNTAFFLTPISFVGNMSVPFGPTLTGTSNSGTVLTEVFNASKTFMIRQVEVIPSVSGPITVQLQNASNVVLASAQFTMVTGTNTLPLDFVVPQGSGFRLVVSQKPSNMTFRIVTAPAGTYPVSLQSFGQITSVLNGTTTSTTVYGAFFNWRLSDICIGSRTPYNVSVTPLPSNNIPTDTFACSSPITLNIAFPNATYAWSNGISTASQSVTTDNNFVFTVTSQGCTTRDSVNIRFSTPPTTASAIPDTIACEGNFEFVLNHDAEDVYWFNTFNNQLLATGDTLRRYFDTTTIVRAETRNYFTGQPLGAVIGQSGLGTQTNANINSVGLKLDALTDCVLKSVSLRASANNTICRINLLSPTGQVISSKRVILSIGNNNVSLYYRLPQANGYRLTLSNISGGQIAINTGVNAYFPKQNTYARLVASVATTGTNVTNAYYYFYDMQFVKEYCTGPSETFRLDITKFPIVNLGVDTNFCGVNSYVLDATNTGVDYQWSTTSASPSVTVTSSGVYMVTVTRNVICKTIDTVKVNFFTQPAAPISQNVSICAPGTPQLLTPQANSLYAWYNQSNAGSTVYLGSPYSPNISNNTTLYVEAAPQTTGEGGLRNHPNPTSGYTSFVISSIFDVADYLVLDSVAVYVNNPTTFKVILTDANNQTLAEQNVTVSARRQKVFLPLNFSIPRGTGYRLKFANLRNAALGFGGTLSYPETYSNILTLTGNSIGTNTVYYFYDWHFRYAAPICRSARVPVGVSVGLPYSLPDSLYLCPGNVATLDAFSPAATSYQWSNASVTSSIQVSTAGLYKVTITGNNCVGIDSVKVGQPLPVGLPADGPICGGNILGHYLPPATFRWNTGATTANLRVTAIGTYSVTVVETGGCTLTDDITITGFTPAPTVALPASITYCNSGVLNPGNIGTTYLWTGGATTQSLNVTATGLYAVTVSTGSGCTVSGFSQVSIDRNLPVANFTFSTNGNYVQFTNLSTNATSYEWSFGAGLPTSNFQDVVYSYSGPGYYNVQLIARNACGADTTVFTIDLLSLPEVQLLSGVKAYPNPVQDLLILDWPIGNDFPANGVLLRLLDYNGRTLREERWDDSQQKQLYLNDLPEGMYLLQMRSEKETGVMKVIKTK